MSFDSDDEDQTQIGLTSVSLGYAGKPLVPKTPLDNHIGGLPVWFENTPPSKELTECSECSSQMDLLVQISAPLDKKWYDRVLYVFACTKPSCQRKDGAVKAVRGVHKTAEIEKQYTQPEPEIAAPVSSLGDTLFGGGASSASNPFANPFAAPLAPEAEAKPAAKDAKKVPKEAKPKPAKDAAKDAQTMPASRFKCLDIEVEEEYLTAADTKIPDNVEVDTEEGEDGPEVKVDSAVDDLMTSITDPVFGRFLGLIDNNPDQVLRYDLPLKPVAYGQDALFATLNGQKKLPGLRFEVQLVPRLISELETDEMLLEGMEWGTIVLATPEDDALPKLDDNGVGYASVWTGVQWEKQVQH